ncbi:MAG: SPOR domain-containing protein [Bacteroidetes bacterium]|nr:SPOR domain-containing protein [Bacteroidota bacterium]MBL6943086.1 SPOR domain-containing protein [Bacteroidales bacterium]
MRYPAISVILLSLYFLLASPILVIGQKEIPNDFCINKQEENLFNMINLLRADYEKPILQLSASLSYVAKLHVNDLQHNNPDTSICNLSSWSDNGKWTPCCYNKYLHDPGCMWDKPKELTPYTYRGYELVTFFEEDFNIDTIINLWSDSREVLNMIFTNDEYSNKKWMCAGIGISENYVSLWFGQRTDKLKRPDICDKGNYDNDPSAAIIATNKLSAYYLIFGSHNNMHAAREARRKIKENNFKNCDILVKNGKYRVYLDKFNTLKEALFAKQQLPFEYSEAWILKD